MVPTPAACKGATRWQRLNPSCQRTPFSQTWSPVSAGGGRLRGQRALPGWGISVREGEAANQFYLLRHGKVALQIALPERGA